MMKLNSMLHTHTEKQIGYIDYLFRLMEKFNMNMERVFKILNGSGDAGLKYNKGEKTWDVIVL